MLRPIFLSGVVTGLSLLIVDLIVPGVDIDTLGNAAIAALSIGLVNSIIKPFVQLISLPATILTLGIFSLVVNGFCFWLSSTVVSGFHVHGIFAFLLGPIVLSIASTFIGHSIFEERPELGEG
ncbi:MAG: phage holin family protein [Okeania sp. SIO2H7]|nr:phage holin family protein [Okeania sp. SIO2H7]